MAEFNNCIFSNIRTKEGKYNLIGVIKLYFDFLYSDPNCNENTRQTYIREYETKIFPLVNENIPIDEIDPNYLNGLIEILIENNDLAHSNISKRFRPLLFRPVLCYFDDPKNNIHHNPFLGTSFIFDNKNINNDIEKEYLKIRKSLTPKQQKIACEFLLNNPETDDGALLGLAIMFFLGTRENEAAGASFRSIRKLLDYTILTIAETTEYRKSTTKIGGKSDNAFRRLILLERFNTFLDKRKEYLRKIVNFPVVTEDGRIINTVEDLPIACVRNNYANRCRSEYISEKGNEFLVEVLKIREIDISGINSMIENKEDFKQYKNPTTYLFRRSFLTDLYLIGFTEEQIEYWAGHEMEASDYTRGMFSSETNLSKINEMIQRLPMNENGNKRIVTPTKSFDFYEDVNNIAIKKAGNYKLVITEKQIDDPITITLNKDDSNDIKLLSYPYDNKQETIIDISKAFKREYEK